MKKLFVFATMLAIAASCTVTEITCLEDNNLEGEASNSKIVATIENDSSSSKTILSVDEDGIGTIYWKPSEKIGVIYGKTAYALPYISSNTINSTEAEFITSEFVSEESLTCGDVWGIYPYDSWLQSYYGMVETILPAEQAGVVNTFDDNLFLMAAHSEDNNLRFRNLCGGIKFSLSRDDIKSVTFSGNNEEILVSEQIQLRLNQDSQPYIWSSGPGNHSVCLRPKNGDTFKSGEYYYIITLPATLSKGFTMTFETENQVGIFKYTTKSVEIKRSVFSKKANIDTYATYVDVPKINTHVDLGLSVEWASCNLGATKPYEFGGYYAWGENEAKMHFEVNNYAHSDNATGKYTKYCFNPTYGSVDNKAELDSSDDAAIVQLGSSWRMPTKAEINELINNTTITRCVFGGSLGYLFQSLVEGYEDNLIFIPAAGYVWYDEIRQENDACVFWSSTLNNNDSWQSSAWDFFADNRNAPMANSNTREGGQSIRPVFQTTPIESVSLNEHNVTLGKGQTTTLVCSVSPENATNKEVYWQSSDESVVTVDSNGKVLAISSGLATVTVTSKKGNKSDSCDIIVPALPEDVNALCFSAETPVGIALTLTNNYPPEGDCEPNFEYSYNGVTWQKWDYSQLVFGDDSNAHVFIRGKNPNGYVHGYANNYATFTLRNMKNSYKSYECHVHCDGNIMSLIDYENEITEIPCNSCFRNLFLDCDGLETAPSLPATILKPYCYKEMFYNCSYLIDGPAELPAMTLSDYCYQNMFSFASFLTNPPRLPATTLATGCYRSMFSGCRDLVTAPELPATELAEYCYNNMFYECINLKNAPVLPALELKSYCYNGMFYNCYKLYYLKALFINSDSTALTDWMKNCADNGTGTGKFERNKNATWNRIDGSVVPTNFQVVNAED